MATELTEQQELFLDTFLEEAFGGTDQALAAVIAKNTAGYAETYSVDKILNTVKDELIKRCQGRLTLSTPKAINEVAMVLMDPTKDGSRRTLEAATIILDRAGITKKEQVEVDIKTDNGIVLIPAKKSEEIKANTYIN